MCPRRLKRGCDLKQTEVSPSLVQDVKALIAQAEEVLEADPGMGDAAAMVYVGDVYVLREEIDVLNEDAERERFYASDLSVDVV